MDGGDLQAYPLNMKLVKMLKEQYEGRLTEKLSWPVSHSDEENGNEDVEKEIMKLFKDQCAGNVKVKEEFRQILDDSLKNYKKDIESTSEAKCKNWLETHPDFTNFVHKVEKEEYSTEEVETFINDSIDLKEKFNNEQKCEIMRESVIGEFLKNQAKKLLYQKTHSTRVAFRNWQENRKKSIKEIKKLSGNIELAENIQKKSQIGYSSAGVVSAGLTIGGIAAAPFTFGASLGLTIAGISTGVISGVAGITHYSFKEKRIKDVLDEATILAKKDKDLSETLEMARNQVKEFYQDITKKLKIAIEPEEWDTGAWVKNLIEELKCSQLEHGPLQVSEFCLGGGVPVRVANVAAAGVHIGEIAKGAARVAGKVAIPLVAVTAVLDLAQIALNIKDLTGDELSKRGKELKDLAKELEKSLKEIEAAFSEKEQAPVLPASTKNDRSQSLKSPPY